MKTVIHALVAMFALLTFSCNATPQTKTNLGRINLNQYTLTKIEYPSSLFTHLTQASSL